MRIINEFEVIIMIKLADKERTLIIYRVLLFVIFDAFLPEPECVCGFWPKKHKFFLTLHIFWYHLHYNNVQIMIECSCYNNVARSLRDINLLQSIFFCFVLSCRNTSTNAWSRWRMSSMNKRVRCDCIIVKRHRNRQRIPQQLKTITRQVKRCIIRCRRKRVGILLRQRMCRTLNFKAMHVS